MNINFAKMDNESKLSINKVKLKNELESLQMLIKNELELMVNSGIDYSSSNELGIISAKGTIIDNLVGRVAVLYSNRQILDMLQNKE